MYETLELIYKRCDGLPKIFSHKPEFNTEGFADLLKNGYIETIPSTIAIMYKLTPKAITYYNSLNNE